ncbi:uncharacterized protein LOC128883698 [Hylaeus volcanicus]|uniref:uncharacterized protein LOC128883698 n=1 Tax=Hylaeus volcanicus TaxID=313075 RepID=UPI0023B7C0FF|nr:uncharacterized protein LOC128883698 [Hylaeus volcanicus]
MAKFFSKPKVFLNYKTFVIQVIALFIALFSLFSNEWLANSSPVIFHPYSRSWGLFRVIGRTIRTHNSQWSTACLTVHKFSLGGCTTPLCKWYSQKCSAFRIISIVSHVTAGLVAASIFATFLSMVFSLRKSIKVVRFSLGFAIVGFILIIASIVLYTFGMEQAFQLINAVGYYPVPQPAVSYIFACVYSLLTLISVILHGLTIRQLSREMTYIQQAKTEATKIREEYGI